MRPQILITGATGLIGSYLLRSASQCAPQFQATGLNRSQFDLLDFKSMDRAFAALKPAAVIHCAALSRSVVCESQPALARQINVEGTRHLSALASDTSLLFFSSDLVFDGLKGDYNEEDPVNPRTIYGETKAEAETLVLHNPRHTVVRCSLTAGRSASGSRTFNEEILNAWKAGRTTSLFKDEFRCPLGATITARAVWELVASSQTGLFHLAGAEKFSRLQIGELLARHCKPGEAKIKETSLADYEGPSRSPDTSLNCSRVQARLSFPLPRFSNWAEQNPEEIGPCHN